MDCSPKRTPLCSDIAPICQMFFTLLLAVPLRIDVLSLHLSPVCPGLKKLVHHSTCKMKWARYQISETLYPKPFMSHLDSTDPWVPNRPRRTWQTLHQRNNNILHHEQRALNQNEFLFSDNNKLALSHRVLFFIANKYFHNWKSDWWWWGHSDD